jgi:hypothetical protein
MAHVDAAKDGEERAGFSSPQLSDGAKRSPSTSIRLGSEHLDTSEQLRGKEFVEELLSAIRAWSYGCLLVLIVALLLSFSAALRHLSTRRACGRVSSATLSELRDDERSREMMEGALLFIRPIVQRGVPQRALASTCSRALRIERQAR